MSALAALVAAAIQSASPMVVDQLPNSSRSVSVPQASPPSRSLDSLQINGRGDRRPLPSRPIGGRDRCDPAGPRPGETAECATLLENRAGEFAAGSGGAPSLESELLRAAGAQRPATVGRTVRALGRGEVSLDGAEGALAGGQPPLPSPDKTKPDPFDEAAQVIFGGTGVPGPAPRPTR